MARFFGRLGYCEQLPEIRLDPSSSALRRALSEWLNGSDRQASDTAVIYYSGHGDSQASQHLCGNAAWASGRRDEPNGGSFLCASVRGLRLPSVTDGLREPHLKRRPPSRPYRSRTPLPGQAGVPSRGGPCARFVRNAGQLYDDVEDGASREGEEHDAHRGTGEVPPDGSAHRGGAVADQAHERGGSGWAARSAEGGYCSARVYPAAGVPVPRRRSRHRGRAGGVRWHAKEQRVCRRQRS